MSKLVSNQVESDIGCIDTCYSHTPDATAVGGERQRFSAAMWT
jgi:hypothetical protein